MNPLSEKVSSRLEAIVGKGAFLDDPADCLAYSYDNSRRQGMPQAVLFASSHDQVLEIIRLCNSERIALIPRGAGTGTTGATVPDQGGIVLSLERMNRIIAIDSANRIAKTQPGVTNKALQDAVAEEGFFWPPDPTSAAACTIGGNLAFNSAGPRAVKYGTPRENTLGLKAVTGSGHEIHTGVITTKGVVGYDLTRLLIGSEGTLAVITEAVLKLTPLPEAKSTFQATYRDINAAARAVSAIMAQPVIPCALEFIDGAAIELVRDFSGIELPAQAGALLMIEVDGPKQCLSNAVDSLIFAAKVDGVIEIKRADTKEEVAILWKTRSALAPAMRNAAPKKINEDIVVPVSRIPDLISSLEQLSAEYRTRIVNFGHAGNGNIHVNLLFDPDDSSQISRAEKCLEAVFSLVLKLGGTLSGEHGVGLEKRDFISREIDPVTLRLMHNLRLQFDPNGILNPGKGLPPV